MEQLIGCIMRFLLVGVLVFVFTLNGSCQASKISAEELSILLDKQGDNIQLLDIRTPGEVSKGKIENAVNYNFYDKQFESNIDRLDRNKVVVVYCAAGYRSAKAFEKLKGLGFLKVYDFQKGFKSWKKKGYPITYESQ